VQHKPDKKVFAVIRLQEGESVLTGKLMRMISKVKESRKGLVLAVIDRRSEVVYYSLKEASI
jgi:tRNA splicing endonuclease